MRWGFLACGGTAGLCDGEVGRRAGAVAVAVER